MAAPAPKYGTNPGKNNWPKGVLEVSETIVIDQEGVFINGCKPAGRPTNNLTGAVVPGECTIQRAPGFTGPQIHFVSAPDALLSGGALWNVILPGPGIVLEIDNPDHFDLGHVAFPQGGTVKVGWIGAGKPSPTTVPGYLEAHGILASSYAAPVFQIAGMTQSRIHDAYFSRGGSVPPISVDADTNKLFIDQIITDGSDPSLVTSLDTTAKGGSICVGRVWGSADW